jgi:hypothetical protein
MEESPVQTSRIAIAALAVIGMASASLALTAPAQAAPLAHLTKNLTGSGTWTIPSGATNIVATLAGAQGATNGGAGGKGGSAGYSLPDADAGATLSYTVGTVGSGSPGRPAEPFLSGASGGGTAIAVGPTLLAVVGGGGGGAGSVSDAPEAGGIGGVATAAGHAVGGDGNSIPGFTAAGQGGQATTGGETPRTATYYSVGGAYRGDDGQDGPAAVAGGVITLAQGGYAGYLGGNGGSGYTGGAGGTSDFHGGVADDGAGGGGSGYLASSGISYLSGSAGTRSGSGLLVINYDVTQLVVTANTSLGGHVGQTFGGNSVSVTSGTSPYGYALATGSTLPSGLTLSAIDGSISGTPTTTGATTVSVVVSDATGQSVSTPVQLSIGLLAVTGPAQASIGGSLQLTGSGYDVGSYDVRLDAATPPIGTAAADGSGALTFTGTVPAVSTPGAHTVGIYRSGLLVASTSVTFVVLLTATATTPPAAFQGQDFSWTPLTVTGGTAPLTYSLQGTLPAGLALNASTGEITGVPASATTLPAAFSVTVTDASAPAQSRAVALDLAVGTLSITAPDSAVIGSTVTLTGAGFEEGDYSVELHSSPIVLGTVHVDATHVLSFTGTIPTSAVVGVHQLQVLRGGVLVSTSTISLVAAPVTIASTGVDAGPGLLLALLLLAAGLAVAMVRRLRHRRS